MTEGRGFALLPVIVICAAIALLVLAVAGDERGRQRQRERISEHTRLHETVGRRLARVEALHRRAADATSGEVTETAGRSGAPIVTVAELFPANAQVTVRAADGAWSRVEVPAWNSARVQVDELEELLRRLTADASEPMPAAAVAWLAAALARIESDAVRDADHLRARVDSICRSAPAALHAAIEVHREHIVTALDPLPRLRRTLSHSQRLAGIDRGRLPMALPVLDHRRPLALRLAGTAQRGSGGVIQRRRRAPLVQQLRLRSQDSWRRGSIDQPGGVEVGAAIGPEVLGDVQWEFGLPERVAGQPDPPAVVPGGLSALPLAPGWLLTGGSGPVQCIVRGVDGWQLHRGRAFPVDGLCSVRGGDRAWFGWRNGRLRWAGGRSLPAPGPEWHDIDLPGPVRQVVADGGTALALVSGQSLFRLTGAGEVTARIDIPFPAVAIFPLPLLDAVVCVTAQGWFRVDRSNGVSPVDGGFPSAVGRAVADGVAGVWWIEPGGRAPAALVHGCFVGNRCQLRRAPLPAGAARLAAFPGRSLVAACSPSGEVSLVRAAASGLVAAGSGTVPQNRLAFACPTSMTLLSLQGSDIWATAIVPRRPKFPFAGGHQLLLPRSWRTGARFRAPLAAVDGGDLDGILCSGAAVTRVPAAGTVNSGGSVLSAPDLSDLVCDGVLLDPRRGETLRYLLPGDGAVGPALLSRVGCGGVLIKVVRTADESAQPSRERVVVRLTQNGRLRFTPDPVWFAARHPAHPAPEQILGVVRHGGAERWFSIVSELVRQPAAGRWVFRRAVTVHGAPWTVTATVAGDPVVQLSVEAGQCFPGPLVSEVAVADHCVPGVWSTIEWGWGDDGSSTVLRVDDHHAVEAGTAAPIAAAFAVFDDASQCEVGGRLGAKAFHGSVQQLYLNDRALPAAAAFPSLVPQQRSGRWILPTLFEPGSRLLRVAALGEFGAGTGIDWELQLWTSDGGRSVSGSGSELQPLPRSFGQPTTVVICWTLRASGDGRRTPLLEGIDIDWLPPPPAGRAR